MRGEVLRDMGKIVVLSAAMCLAVWLGGILLRQGLDPAVLYARGRLAKEVACLIALAALVYFPLAHFWGLDYLAPLLARRRKKV